MTLLTVLRYSFLVYVFGSMAVMAIVLMCNIDGLKEHFEKQVEPENQTYTMFVFGLILITIISPFVWIELFYLVFVKWPIERRGK